ncbi:hypothetical protein CI102_7793 [Trichoderma harzianum]|nr:hypothetical protein CI102_7793 [Trichoderma harzianum]
MSESGGNGASERLKVEGCTVTITDHTARVMQKIKRVLCKTLLEKAAKHLGDPDEGVDANTFFTEMFGKDVNEVVEDMMVEISDRFTTNQLSSRTHSEFRLTLNNSKEGEVITEEVVPRVLGEIFNDEIMDGPGVSSSMEKLLLELHGELAKLNAKMDNLTQYHKTGKWPDN